MRFPTFDAAYAKVCRELAFSPEFVSSPRGKKIHENLAVTFVLDDPRARVIENPEREASLAFGVGEFLWYWQGKRDLATMQYYNRRMPAFSNDGMTLNSAYGWRLRKEFPRWRGDAQQMTQWDVALLSLVQDRDSRRAVMLINDPHDQYEAVTASSKDVPCTLALQFFIRDGKLHLHGTMRSNDVIWGLTYDLFSFTLMQECMVLDLKRNGIDVELGTYRHTAGSLHVYEDHLQMAERVSLAHSLGTFDPGRMPPLTSLEMLEELCVDEALLRARQIQTIDTGKYRGGERWMAEILNSFREKRDREGAK